MFITTTISNKKYLLNAIAEAKKKKKKNPATLNPHGATQQDSISR